MKINRHRLKSNVSNTSESKLHYRSKTSRLTVKSHQVANKKRGRKTKPEKVKVIKQTTKLRGRSVTTKKHIEHDEPEVIEVIDDDEEDEEDEEENDEEEQAEETSDDDVIEDDDDDDDNDSEEEDVDIEEIDADEENEDEEEEEDNDDDMSVLVLSSGDEAKKPAEVKEPVKVEFSSPGRKILNMARKSTSPYKNQIKQPTVTFPSEHDILTRREILKTEKQQAATSAGGGGKSGGNGMRAACVHANSNLKKYHSESVMSTTGLIDYFITGSKETERLLGHERIETLSKVLDEFRKACKIYAEIAIRQRYNPSFLNRNLSYLAEERKRPRKKKRKKFRVDDLLKQKMSEKTSCDLFDLSIKLLSIDLKNIEDRQDLLKIPKSASSSAFGVTILAFESVRITGDENLQQLGRMSLDQFDIRKSSQDKLTLSAKSGFEFKLNPQSFPYICIKLKIGDKTFVAKQPVERLLSNAATDSLEFMFTLERDDAGVLECADEEDLKIDDLISKFMDSNQIRVSVRKIPMGGKNMRNTSAIQTKSISNGSSPGKVKKEKVKPSINQQTSNKMVYYQFTTTSSTKSNRSGEFKILTYHTEPSNSFECPFCKLSSLFSESSLLNHLTHSHPRFAAQLNSKGNPTNGEPIRIELVIDPLYDASYASKHQHTLFGYPQSLHGPQRLIDYMIKNTHVIVNKRVTSLYLAKCRGQADYEIIEKQVIAAVVEQALRNDDANINRVFYHTTTWQPVLSQSELDIDSDEDIAPEWLREHSQFLINDFSDLNDGEKRLMYMWNMHCLSSQYAVSDRQVVDICMSFITRETHNIVKARLQRNFVSHLRDLIDFGLLSVDAFLRLIDVFNELVRRKKQ